MHGYVRTFPWFPWFNNANNDLIDVFNINIVCILSRRKNEITIDS